MAVDASKVRVAITGALSKGELSATAPTTAAAAATGFTDLGGISEDGVTLALNDEGDSTPIKVWQNGQTVRTLRQTSEDNPTISGTLVETSLDTIETYFGATVTQTATDGSFEFKSQVREAASYVLDVIDGAELIRIYVPRGVVASVGEITLANTEAIGYEVTIECELDSTKGYNFKSFMTALKTA
ncbi:phage tail tube protein [Nocardioides terrigena]|uniref:phage tail tube protein n=1 Tax=Nocardioides terrigena TaxID=424797 RepID=UPI00131EDCE5|nr:hypothetical protein [Nocardioides terrigena]